VNKEIKKVKKVLSLFSVDEIMKKRKTKKKR
jgi:hypothetical protein